MKNDIIDEEINFGTEKMITKIDLDKAEKELDKYTEYTKDKNGRNIRIVYLDDNYNVVSKDESTRKCIEYLKDGEVLYGKQK